MESTLASEATLAALAGRLPRADGSNGERERTRVRARGGGREGGREGESGRLPRADGSNGVCVCVCVPVLSVWVCGECKCAY